MTSLACFLPGTVQQVHPYPVLFSEAVQGPTLEEVLTKNQPLHLEPEHYSDMVLMAMLTIPLDGKPANYIVETIAGTIMHRLVCVDNALSFGLPVTKQATPDGYQLNLQLITILFCFDEMRQIIHSSSRKRWLALDSHALLQTWLSRLVVYNERCFVEGKLFPARACQHWHDREPDQSVLLPFLLLPETIIDVYRRLKQIQSFLDKNPTCTHEDLLDSVLPYVKHFYAPCWEQITLPVRDRFIQLAEQHNSIEIHHLPPSVAPAAGEAKEASHKTLMISSRRLCHLEQTWISQIPTKLFSNKKDLVSILSKVKAQANQYQEQLNRLKLRYDSVEALRGHLLDTQPNWDVILRELQQLQSLIPEVLETVLNGEGIHSMRVKISKLSPSIQTQLFSIINGNPFRRLYLSECTLLTSRYLKQLLNSSPYLEALDVSGCIQLTEADILNIGIQCRKLKALNISKLHLTKLDILAYYPFFSTSLYFYFPELERLWVEGCVQLITLNLDTTSLQKLVLQACPALQQVTLYSDNTVAIVPTLPFIRQQGCPQAMKLPNEVRAFVLTNPRATELRLASSNIGFTGWQQINTLFKINRSLTTLNLSLNQIGDTGAQHVAEALKVNLSLPTMDLSGNKIGDTGAQHLAEALKVNLSLPTMNLGSNKIGDTGVQHLADALKVNHSLTTLKLQHNQIRETSAQHLAEAFKFNHSLTTLDLSSNRIEDTGAQHLAEVLKSNHSLTTLDLANISIGHTGAQHLAKVLKVNHSLTTLSLGYNEIGDTGAQHLAEALKSNHSLTTLDLCSIKIRAPSAQHLADALKVNQSLTTLNLEDNGIRDRGAQHLAEGLKVNHSLAALNLENNEIGDTGAQDLAEALKSNHSLTTLDLANISIGHTGAQHLAKVLKVNHSLTTLSLGYNEIGDTGAQHLAEALKSNHSLTTLDLCSIKIRAPSAQHLADVLKVNQSLTTLNLEDNGIRDRGAQHLAEGLKVNHSLAALNLENNEIGDTGAQDLAEALKSNHSLTTLDLANISIGHTGAQHLAKVLKVNHSLTTLSLGYNEIGDTGAQHLAEALKSNHSLTTLDLCSIKIRAPSAQHLADALKVNQSLTTLNLEDNGIRDRGAQHLAEGLKVNHSLAALNLENNEIGDTGAQDLAEALKFNHSLAALNLERNSIGDTGVQHLTETLKVNHSLTTLGLGINKIGTTGAQHLAEALKVNHSLTTLDLRCNEIRDTGAQHLAKALEVNHSLTTLNLRSIKIRATGAQHLAKALKVNHSLTILSLEYNEIGDTGAQRLAKALEVNHSLTTLDLSSNKIEDTGAQHLAEALKVNHSLTTLNLGYNEIGDTGVQHLTETLKVNHSLTTLGLGTNLIWATGAQHLAEASKVNHFLTTLDLDRNEIENANNTIIKEYLARNRVLRKAIEAPESRKHLQPLIHKALVLHTERDRLQGAHSLYTRGLQYLDDERVRPNPVTAAHYFKQAAEIGHGEAQVMLAKAYKIGQGLRMQPLLALFWFARAQENGIPAAFIEFSQACTHLEVLAKFTDYLNPKKQINVNWQADDPFETIPWHTLEKQLFWRNLTYRLIALNTQKNNHQVVEAQYILAQAYENGDGVPHSFLTATYWCQKAVRQHYSPAINMLQKYHKLLDVDKKMLHPSSTDALPELWSKVFREIPPIQAVPPSTNTPFQLFNLTNTEAHPHTQKLYNFIQQLVHTTSDRFGYQSMRFEPARIKGLLEQQDLWKALKKECYQPPFHQGFISSIQMTEMHLVHHPALWQRYQKRKQRLKAELQEAGIHHPTDKVHWQESLSNGLPVLDPTLIKISGE